MVVFRTLLRHCFILSAALHYGPVPYNIHLSLGLGVTWHGKA